MKNVNLEVKKNLDRTAKIRFDLNCFCIKISDGKLTDLIVFSVRHSNN